MKNTKLKHSAHILQKRSNTPILIFLWFILIIYFTLVPAIPQDLNYHCFAGDEHSVGTIPHFLNVASNLFFCFAGLIGLYRLKNWAPSAMKTRWQIFYWGIFMVGVGSGYYHYHPTTLTLFWDRFPMAVSFIALVANFMADRFDIFRRWSFFWLLLFLGAYSTLSWILTEIWGRGDLRLYILVQFGTMALVFLSLIKIPKPGDRAYWLLLGGYTLAKVFEMTDLPIYEITQYWISGHVLKHLVAGLVLCLFFPKESQIKQ